MKFERVQQVRLHEQIIARFNEMAEAGYLKPGDRLPPEREMLTQFGVSRQVLREALTVMEFQGMLSTTPGGGRVFNGRVIGDANGLIQALKDSALLEIITAREAIEVKLAELAALHATEEEIADLRERITTLQATNYTFEWNYKFHLAIAEASRNSILHNMLQLLLQARREVQERDYLAREQLERLFADHEKIIDAIEQGDPAIAGATMRQHIETTRRAFEERIEALARERRASTPAR